MKRFVDAGVGSCRKREAVSDETAIKLAILYADVSGSTRIYETYGDTVASKNIERCLSILANITTEGEGRVVKTIGDEVMCAFPNPVRAVMAAKEMHQALHDASEAGRFDIGAMHVKIGWHYGLVNYRSAEIIGEAPVIAQQVIRLAKAGEILASEQSLANLPEELKQYARLIDTVEAEGYQGVLNVYSLPWEEEDEVTRMGSVASGYENVSSYKSLVLECADKTLRLDSDHTRCRIGRSPENDLCVHGKFTSKQHADIVFTHGRFHLQDNSTNGTAIITAEGHTSRLHREMGILSGQGVLCFGGLPETDPDAAVHFLCEANT